MLLPLTPDGRASIERYVAGKVWCFVVGPRRGDHVGIAIAIADEIGPRQIARHHCAANEDSAMAAHVAELNACLGVYPELAAAITESMHAANAKARVL